MPNYQDKLTLDNLIDKIIEQMKQIEELEGVVNTNLSRGYIVWSSVYNQYKANLKYIAYLKSLK